MDSGELSGEVEVGGEVSREKSRTRLASETTTGEIERGRRPRRG